MTDWEGDGMALSPDRPGRRGSTPELSVIVDTAARLFYDRGYKNTSMQDLSDALRITKPTLYVHGKGKLEILGLIFARVADEMNRVVAEATAIEDPVMALSHVVRELTRVSVRYGPHYGVFQGDIRELPLAMRKKYLGWSRDFVDALRDVVARGQREGVLNSQLDPIVAAFAMIGMTNWSSQWLRTRGRLPLETVAENFAEIALHGMSNSSTPARSGSSNP
jgi:AcrR family transcriptional regulator